MEEKKVLESFVARIWLERGSNGDPLWRGHVRHVQGNQEAFFQDLETMTQFLERVSGVPGPRPTAGPAENAGVPKPGPAAKGKDA
jgi:hypothetical protein